MKYFTKIAVSSKLVAQAAANRLTMQKHLQKAVDKGSHKVNINPTPSLDLSKYVGKDEGTGVFTRPASEAKFINIEGEVAEEALKLLYERNLLQKERFGELWRRKQGFPQGATKYNVEHPDLGATGVGKIYKGTFTSSPATKAEQLIDDMVTQHKK